MTDAQMLKKLQAHQEEALEQLMKKYHRYGYTVIANIICGTGGTEDMEELVQDTFYGVWSHADAIHPGKLKPYLGSTARNNAKSWLRNRKELPMALDTVELPDPHGSLDESAQREELARYIQAALQKMSPKDREIFLRHYYYLQTATEISAHMGIPRSTVLSRLLRGRKKLEKTLQNVWASDA
jgi:RNA polymerase sigma-70 factor (ECF subfamily)